MWKLSVNGGGGSMTLLGQLQEKIFLVVWGPNGQQPPARGKWIKNNMSSELNNIAIPHISQNAQTCPYEKPNNHSTNTDRASLKKNKQKKKCYTNSQWGTIIMGAEP